MRYINLRFTTSATIVDEFDDRFGDCSCQCGQALEVCYENALYKLTTNCLLPAPLALWCLPSGSLPSVAGLSRLLLHASGTPWQMRRRQLSRWRHSVNISRHGSSDNGIQTSSSDFSPTDCHYLFFNLEVAMLLKGFLIDCLIDCYECIVLRAVAGSRAKEPFDSDSARGPLLHEAAGVRTALHSLTESDTPRSQAGKHAAQWGHGTKDCRLWTRHSRRICRRKENVRYHYILVAKTVETSCSAFNLLNRST